LEVAATAAGLATETQLEMIPPLAGEVAERRRGGELTKPNWRCTVQTSS